MSLTLMIESIVVVSGLVLGSFIILAVIFKYLKGQKMGSTDILLTLIGVGLVSLFLWQNVKLSFDGKGGNLEVISKNNKSTTSDPSAGVPTITSNLSDCSKENFKSSMVEIDYSNLCASLQQKKWKQADSETLNLLLKLSDIQGRRVLDSQEIKRLPCTDLKTIDNLWLKYSSNIFGFSEQNKIWRQNNGSREVDTAGWDSLVKTGYDFGWRRSADPLRKDWYLPNDIISKVDPSRRGMLPRLADGDDWRIQTHFSYLWDKLGDCS